MDSASPPANDVAASPTRTRPGIPTSVRRAIKTDEQCRYCGAMWASQIDHVIPVAQGGSSTAPNLAHACLRCNTEKSGRTPAQWKASRLSRGLSWPPPNCDAVLVEIMLPLSEHDFLLVHRATVAEYPPITAVVYEIHDRYYAETPALPETDRAELLAIATAYAAEIDV